MTGASAKTPTGVRLASPDVGEEEIEAVARVLRTPILTNGPETAAFETEFAALHEAPHGVAFANGTVALAAMLTAVGVGPGDEVIVPSLTFVSTATSVLHVGATPVFADVDPSTFNLDPTDAARHLTPRTRAILAVHYAGQPADLDALQDLASAAGVVLLEDAAQAHGATFAGKPVGTWGRAAMFSFTPTKNITTGEGGVVLTSDGRLAATLRLLRNHGQSSPYLHTLVGFNWRITEMQAAIGRVQVAKLPGILERKAKVSADLDRRISAIAGVQPPALGADRTHVHMLYTVTFDCGPVVRDRVCEAMAAAGVETKVYFPPVHRQPIFSGCTADLPVTDDLAGRILSLPVHSKLTAADVAYVTDTLGDALAAGEVDALAAGEQVG